MTASLATRLLRLGALSPQPLARPRRGAQSRCGAALARRRGARRRRCSAASSASPARPCARRSPPWDARGARGMARRAARLRLARRSRRARQRRRLATRRGDWTADWLAAIRHLRPAVAWRADVIGDRLFAWLEHFDRARARRRARATRCSRSFARQTRHLARVAAREGAGLCRGSRRCAASSPRSAALGHDRAPGARARATSRARSTRRSCPMAAMSRAARQRSSRRCAISIDARAALLAAQIEIPGATCSRRSTAPRRCCASSATATAASRCSTAPTRAIGAIIDRVLDRADAKGRAPASARRIAASSGCRPAHRWCCSIAARRRRRASTATRMPARCRFEMSYGRERLIVNCGAYHGPSAEWRAATARDRGAFDA